MGFNTGFGAGNLDLLLSWMPDLQAIADSGVMSLFTCANDYGDLKVRTNPSSLSLSLCLPISTNTGDLKGETAVMQNILGVDYVISPSQNPFRAATYAHEPGKKETAWSCSSSYMYAIQGWSQGRSGPIHKVVADHQGSRAVSDSSTTTKGKVWLNSFWEANQLSWGAAS
jgi:hypothetical protein